MNLPLTYLFVPGDRPERFEKALASEAGAVIVDLEDAVAPQAKASAREAAVRWWRANPAARARVLLRINHESTPWFDEDLAAVDACAVPGVVLPKVESALQIERVRAALPDGGWVIPMIESARGARDVARIAAAAGVQRIAFGSLDYAVDLDLSGENRGLDYAAARMAVESRVAGIASPVAGVTPEIGDEAKLLADLAWARTLGFGAKLCIHPRQVQAIHRALRPSEAEIDWAARVVAAAESGLAAFQVDGRMVDRPIVLKARAILERAGR